jgi:hypothetical protein
VRTRKNKSEGLLVRLVSSAERDVLGKSLKDRDTEPSREHVNHPGDPLRPKSELESWSLIICPAGSRADACDGRPKKGLFRSR